MTTAIAKTFDESLRAQLWANKGRFVSALDGQVEFDRFAVIAVNAVRRTPKLAECSMASVVESIAKCAELGLEPNGPLGHAYLVPFKGEAKLLVGYKGWVHVMFRGGALLDAEAHVVYEEDIKNGFKLTFGAQTFLKHPFTFTPLAARGKPVGAYAVLRFVGGGVHVEPMTWDEIMKAKAVSPSSGNADSPWQLWESEMVKKTVLKRAAKWAPTGRDYALVAKAHEYDDENTVDGATVPLPATVAPTLPSATQVVHEVIGQAAEVVKEAAKKERKLLVIDKTTPDTPTAEEEVGQTKQSTVPTKAGATFEDVCRELYAAKTTDDVDAVAEKFTGYAGDKRAELATRFKERRKEVSRLKEKK